MANPAPARPRHGTLRGCIPRSTACGNQAPTRSRDPGAAICEPSQDTGTPQVTTGRIGLLSPFLWGRPFIEAILTAHGLLGGHTSPFLWGRPFIEACCPCCWRRKRGVAVPLGTALHRGTSHIRVEDQPLSRRSSGDGPSSRLPGRARAEVGCVRRRSSGDGPSSRHVRGRGVHP